MIKTNKSPLFTLDYWITVFTMFTVATLLLLLKIEWYIMEILD